MKYLRPFFVLAILCWVTGTASSQKFDAKLSRNTPEILKVFRPVVAQPSEYTVRVKCDGKDVAFGTIIESDGLLRRPAAVYKITIKTKSSRTRRRSSGTASTISSTEVDASGLPIVEWRDSKKKAWANGSRRQGSANRRGRRRQRGDAEFAARRSTQGAAGKNTPFWAWSRATAASDHRRQSGSPAAKRA